MMKTLLIGRLKFICLPLTKLRFLILFILTSLPNIFTFSQGGFSCDYIDYFKPLPTDPILYVKTVVVIFHPDADNGVWKGTTFQDMQDVIDAANAKLASMPPPAASTSISGVQSLTHARIQLTLTGVYNEYSDLTYTNALLAYTGSSLVPTSYDPNYLNVFLVKDLSQINYAVTRPNNSAPGDYLKIAANAPFNYKDPYWIGAFQHELGHMLGLTHANNSDPVATITLTPAECGCNFTTPGDYYVIQPGETACGTGGKSNNAMNPSSNCQDYFSPGQLGIMHYHLRTIQPTWLTVASYSDATTALSSRDYTVTSTQTWSGGPRYYWGNVTVPYGVSLTIQCKVGMTNKGKIIVKRGGKLIVDGGIITNISGRLWEGIDVEGNPALAQNTPSLIASHGQLAVNGGTLENSINAVRNYGYDAAGNMDPNTIGGIIQGDGGIFKNNVRDVEFLYYPINYVSASRFDNCEFRATGPINEGGAPYTHVTLFSIKGVQFNGCWFENDATLGQIGEGIHSADAEYSLNKSTSSLCVFKNFDKGISVFNTNPLRPVNIYDAAFMNNYKSITLSNVSTNYISGNTFTLTGNSYGIYLNNCKNYSVMNNTITSANKTIDYGIYASYSGTGAHTIYRNTFTNLSAAIIPQFDNSGTTNIGDGLVMNCNVFNAGTANNYDIAMLGADGPNASLHPTVARVQGNPLVYSPSKVRNQYGAPCTGGSGQKKWYINVVKRGILHPSNVSPAAMQPTPQPACSNSTIQITSGPAFVFTTHCLPNNGISQTEGSRYGNLSKSLSDSRDVVNTLGSAFNDSIDGGDTQSLLNLVNDASQSPAAKKTQLLLFSPYLSDDVLIDYFSNSSIPAQDIIDVHDANKPVSEDVWSAIVALELDEISLGTLGEQQQEINVSERDVLEGELLFAKFGMQHIYSEKLNYFLTDTLEGAKDTVISMLATNIGGIPDAPINLVNAYADGGYYTRAFAYADSLKDDNNYEEIMNLKIALLKLDTSSKKLFKTLDESNIRELIENYASDSTMAGCWQARAVLNYIYGAPMHFQCLEPETQEGRGAHSNESPDLEKPIKIVSTNPSDQISIFPNPTEGDFNISYYSSNNLPCSFSVVDILGKVLYSGKLEANSVKLIEGKFFDNGIYFINLIKDNSVIEKQKVVILK